jgi:hypothetical protein
MIARAILTVNRISNAIAGNGRTIIASIISIAAGVPNPDKNRAEIGELRVNVLEAI